ncbi:hypothetical protein RUM43_010880 [Polyplax serrata]|uniref:C-mannosyltransferase DPY19L1 n=1 Tax=Polyplax serrata TaxID=468196 RepID=A0AAN8P454_POLSC
MGFYYHYYKKIVSAPTFELGLSALLQDNQTEYPEVINALQRFNLYPEIIIGGLFRIFDSVTKSYDISTKQCWEVNRGQTLPPVNSCEGLGDPMYFYLEFVWYCAGLSKAVLFIYAVVLSNSFTGGLLTVLGFLYNHGHCTRVQWTPPLRESFAYPFCLLQMLAVTYCLKNTKNKVNSKLQLYFQMWSITITSTLSLVLWQFSQFVLATQVIAVLLLFCTGIIHKRTILVILVSQLIGLLQAAVFLFGNEFLFQSILFSLLLATIAVIMGCEFRIHNPMLHGFFVLTSILAIAFSLKSKINQFFGAHDAHVFEIIQAKLSNFRTFHTMLYTCSAEFDFLPLSTIYDMSITGLIPTVAVVVLMLLFKWSKHFPIRKKKLTFVQNVIDPEVVYNLLQLAAFTVMTIFIMRLKLFWSPHMCLMASLIMSTKYFPSKSNLRYCLLTVLIAAMSYQGVNNIIKQRNIMGEYVNIAFEEVLTWITSETLPTDVFAGPMSVMANVLLSTGRRIVNHPHYENEDMRERTMKVYSVFSRQNPEQVYATLVAMGVDYVILDEAWCYPRSKPNCSMVDLWDLVDHENRGNEPVCPKLFEGNSGPFIRTFANEVFVVLSLKARQFVEILPLQQYQI